MAELKEAEYIVIYESRCMDCDDSKYKLCSQAELDDWLSDLHQYPHIHDVVVFKVSEFKIMPTKHGSYRNPHD